MKSRNQGRMLLSISTAVCIAAGSRVLFAVCPDPS